MNESTASGQGNECLHRTRGDLKEWNAAQGSATRRKKRTHGDERRRRHISYHSLEHTRPQQPAIQIANLHVTAIRAHWPEYFGGLYLTRTSGQIAVLRVESRTFSTPDTLSPYRAYRHQPARERVLVHA